MFCDDASLLGIGPGDTLVRPLYCRRWTCETCFERRCRELRGLAAEGEPTTLITLTVNPKHFSGYDHAAKELVRAWRNIRQRAAREKLAQKIPFLAVFESTKNGWPHLHILCRAPFIPHAWLSARCRDYLRSPVVDIRAVYSRRHASRYVAKYVSKSPHRFKGVKRYWRSQDYATQERAPKPVADRNRAWLRSHYTVHDWEQIAQHWGWYVLDDDTDGLILTPSTECYDPERWKLARDDLDDDVKRLLGGDCPRTPVTQAETSTGFTACGERAA